ncbi:LPD7 domain-containing protein [Klebsiella pneumoniae]
MLIRFDGGHDGIAPYLVHGRKAGRLWTRDQLDERLIDSIDSKGDRYLHITLAFAEREISTSTLRSIVDDFRQLLMAAYQPDEYNFYAEAHAPRLQRYTNLTTGEDVERLLHVHFVMPKLNLVSGQRLDPVGKADHNVMYFDAIQEFLNLKYGLVSPKERPRDGKSVADIHKRHRVDEFKKGRFRDVKAWVRDEIAQRGIADSAGLHALLAEIGAVKTVNAGKAGREYFAVKPEWSRTYINLRGPEFGAALGALTGEAPTPRVGVGKRTSQDIEACLAEWQQVRAREVKYLNSGSKKKYAAYRAADRTQKLARLDEMEQRFYRKHQREETRHDNRNQSPAGPVLRQSDVEKIAGRAPSKSIHSVQSVHQRGVDRNARNPQMLLPGAVSNELDGRRARADRAVRRHGNPRPGQSVRVNPATGRERDSALSQMRRDDREQAAKTQDEVRAEFATIKAELDARRLLADLSSTHNLLPDDYVITKWPDGSGDRIRHRDSKTNHNVSDFLTKCLAMSWDDAREYLRESYKAQRQLLPSPSVPATPQRAFWEQFTTDRIAYQAQEKRRLREAIKQLRADQARLRADFKRDREALRARRMSRTTYKQELSVRRMQRVELETYLSDQIAEERKKLQQVRGEIEPRDLYRMWLAERAQAGDPVALMELRRQSRYPRVEPKGSVLIGTVRDPGTALPKADSGVQYVVNQRGDVTYLNNLGIPILRDTSHAVEVFQQTPATVEKALRLALAKFGPRGMTVSGPPEFVQMTIDVIAAKGLRVEFDDPELQRRVDEAIARRRLDEVTAAGKRYTTLLGDGLSAPAPVRRGTGKKTPNAPPPATTPVVPSGAPPQPPGAPLDLTSLRDKVEAAAKARADRAKTLLPPARPDSAPKPEKK